ncbi:MAG: hypothetical protein UD299_09230 [Ruminococcus sp.]|jgi:hypothetical protein|nr:hypothetical protein [Ruminococcus sp.]
MHEKMNPSIAVRELPAGEAAPASLIPLIIFILYSVFGAFAIAVFAKLFRQEGQKIQQASKKTDKKPTHKIKVLVYYPRKCFFYCSMELFRVQVKFCKFSCGFPRSVGNSGKKKTRIEPGIVGKTAILV